MDGTVNKPLRLESVTSAVPRITWEDSPGLPPPFLHTASDQKLEVRKAWEQGYLNACWNSAEAPRQVSCVLPLHCGPSGLVIRASD